MRTRTTLLATIVSSLLIASASLAQEGVVTGPTLGDIKRQLDEIKATLKSSLIDLQTTNDLTFQALKTDIKAVKEQLDKLETRVNALNSQVSTRVSAASPAGGLPTATGRVRLVNEYLDEMSVVLNGGVYRLSPGQTVEVTVAPGVFNYQVVGVQSNMTTSTVAGNETRLIRIFPR